MKNKRADISITILVLGVVAICVLTIFSFVGSNHKMEGDFVGPGLVETVKAVALENNNLEFTSKPKDGFERINIQKKADSLQRITKIKINGDEIIGTYTLEKPKIGDFCMIGLFKLSKKCSKDIVKVIS